jgi:hypothetical protein
MGRVNSGCCDDLAATSSRSTTSAGKPAATAFSLNLGNQARNWDSRSGAGASAEPAWGVAAAMIRLVMNRRRCMAHA